MDRKNQRYSGLEEYLQSAGTLLPASASLLINRGDNGNDFEQADVCVFCERENTNMVFKVILYHSKSIKMNDTYTVSPYKICNECNYSGMAILSSFRKSLKDRGLIGEKIAYKNGSMITSRLENYLDSEGEILPSDFFKYRSGGTHAGQCVFCRDVPAEYEVKRWKPTTEYSNGAAANKGFPLSVDTGTYCCRTCQIPVLNMEERFTEDSLFPMADLGVEATTRITKFVRTGFVDDTILHHFNHIPSPPDEDSTYPYEGYWKNNCYFCKGEDSRLILLEAPVNGVTGTINGGLFCACEKCADHFYDMLSETSPNVKTLSTKLVCGNCKKFYSVMNAEADVRAVQDKFLCPVCAFNQNFLARHPNPLLRPHPGTIFRYQSTVCHFCSNDVHIDLCIKMEEIKTENMLNDNDFHCSVCNYNGKLPIFVQHGSRVLLRIYANVSNLTVLVYNTDDTLVDKLITSTNTDIESSLIEVLRNFK